MYDIKWMGPGWYAGYPMSDGTLVYDFFGVGDVPDLYGTGYCPARWWDAP